MKLFNRKKAKRFVTTATDIGSMIVALIFVIYVGLMLYLNLGYKILNYCMLVVTVIYVLFFIFKIFYINHLDIGGKIKKITKETYQYVKYGMRIVNAVYVILGLINVRISTSHIVSMIGIIILVITFVISILWDITLYLIRKKIKEVMAEWNSLEGHEKREKIDFLIEKFLVSLDNMDISNYVDAGTKRIMKLKLLPDETLENKQLVAEINEHELKEIDIVEDQPETAENNQKQESSDLENIECGLKEIDIDENFSESKTKKLKHG